MHARGWLDAGVPRQTPASSGFRRRLPLELSIEELDLLERLQNDFASKRATLVAGLEALAARAGQEAELARLTAERDQTLDRTGELEGRLARLEKALEKSEKNAKASRDGQALKQREARARAAAEQEAAAGLRGELEQAQAIRSELERELTEFEERWVDALLCQRCNQWLSPEEWASQHADGREYLYCKRCGYQTGSPISNASILAYRDHD
jgi:hypothetical protein